MNDNKKNFIDGFKDGIPIGLGYFAVSFSLGIIAKKAELTPLEGFFASFFTAASAGEYGVFNSMIAKATYLEIVLITFIANARYMLMSCALSQKFDNKTNFLHRLFVGFYITDEIFGVTIARDKYIKPVYTYGAILASVPLWGLGTAFGIQLGSILPSNIVSALSVALYGMFIAIIIPPSKKNKNIFIIVLISFILSFLFSILPYIKLISSGFRTIILTVLISTVAAIVVPTEK